MSVLLSLKAVGADAKDLYPLPFPKDVLFVIFQRCDANSYISLGLVCKTVAKTGFHGEDSERYWQARFVRKYQELGAWLKPPAHPWKAFFTEFGHVHQIIVDMLAIDEMPKAKIQVLINDQDKIEAGLIKYQELLMLAQARALKIKEPLELAAFLRAYIVHHYAIANAKWECGYRAKGEEKWDKTLNVVVEKMWPRFTKKAKIAYLSSAGSEECIDAINELGGEEYHDACAELDSDKWTDDNGQKIILGDDYEREEMWPSLFPFWAILVPHVKKVMRRIKENVPEIYLSCGPKLFRWHVLAFMCHDVRMQERFRKTFAATYKILLSHDISLSKEEIITIIAKLSWASKRHAQNPYFLSLKNVMTTATVNIHPQDL